MARAHPLNPQLEPLLAALVAAGVKRPRARKLAGACVASVLLVPKKGATGQLGGFPALPLGSPWPTFTLPAGRKAKALERAHPGLDWKHTPEGALSLPLAFVADLDLAALTFVLPASPLPPEGRLLLFARDELPGLPLRALLVPRGTRLMPAVGPALPPRWKSPAAYVEPQVRWSLPAAAERKLTPDEGERAVLEPFLAAQLREGEGDSLRMLGTTPAAEHALRRGELLLLQVTAAQPPGLCLGLGSGFLFTVRAAAAREGDLSRVRGVRP